MGIWGTDLVFLPAFDLQIFRFELAEGHHEHIGQVGIGDQWYVEVDRRAADGVIVVKLIL